jgi:hypothetical protein
MAFRACKLPARVPARGSANNVRWWYGVCASDLFGLTLFGLTLFSRRRGWTLICVFGP